MSHDADYDYGYAVDRYGRDVERRAFVALPLMELEPALVLPPHGVPIQALAAGFQTPGGKAEEEFSQDLRTRFLRA